MFYLDTTEIKASEKCRICIKGAKITTPIIVWCCWGKRLIWEWRRKILMFSMASNDFLSTSVYYTWLRKIPLGWWYEPRHPSYIKTNRLRYPQWHVFPKINFPYFSLGWVQFNCWLQKIKSLKVLNTLLTKSKIM